MTLDKTLRDEYIGLFDTCMVIPARQADVDGFIARLMKSQIRYQTIQNLTKVPWFVVGLIHGMECSFSFEQHLHNGDSLKARTWQVPAGRPKIGNPPFRWEDSAVDALEYDGFTGWDDWSVAGICFKLEGYNGWGTRRYHHINTPYLWSFSNHYSHGKYVADGKWDSKSVSKQVGAITALWQMTENKQVALPAQEV
jgi:lysozyme family protein